MTQYSYINLVKREAKAYGKSMGVPLAMAQEHVARDAGFAHYHEMVTVSKTTPSDPRLMRRAVGVSSLEDVLYRDPIWAALDSLVEDTFSGAIADTNATGFIIDNLEVSSAYYDENVGVLTLEVYFEYRGEQDLDRVWHGSEFYVDAQIQLIFRDGWEFVEEDPLVVTGCKTDQDLDHEAEQAYEDEQYRKAKKQLNDSHEDPFDF
jgi:hypothetical protein